MFIYTHPLRPHPFRLHNISRLLRCRGTPAEVTTGPSKHGSNHPVIYRPLMDRLYGALVAAPGGSDTAGCSPRISGETHAKL